MERRVSIHKYLKGRTVNRSPQQTGGFNLDDQKMGKPTKVEACNKKMYIILNNVGKNMMIVDSRATQNPHRQQHELDSSHDHSPKPPSAHRRFFRPGSLDVHVDQSCFWGSRCPENSLGGDRLMKIAQLFGSDIIFV